MNMHVLLCICIFITSTTVYGAPPDLTTAKSVDTEGKAEDKLAIKPGEQNVKQMEQHVPAEAGQNSEQPGSQDPPAETADKAKQPGVNPEEMLHDSGVDEHNKPQATTTTNPKFNVKAGAQDPEELMHGSDKVHDGHGGDKKNEHGGDGVGDDGVPSSVMDPDEMMHGAGHSHNQKADVKAAEDNAPSSVMDPDAMMHGEGQGHNHDGSAGKEQQAGGGDGPLKYDTVDPELAMHAEGGHVHEKAAETKTAHLPRESSDLDPDQMMHGGEHHTHDKPASAAADSGQTAEGAPRGNSNIDPDSAMHGGGGHHHDGEAGGARPASSHSGKVFDKPNMEDALHGGDEDHVHDKPKQEGKKPTRMAGMSDPDAVLAGHMDELIGEHGQHIAKEQESTTTNKLGKAGDDEAFLDFSFPSISNTIIKGIQNMKKRWLPKFFNNVEAPDVDTEGHDEPVPVAEPHEHGTGQAADDGTDMRHDLDSIGNTKPLKNHGKHTHKLKGNADLKHDEG